MNELFNELITEIMLLGEAGKKPAAKSAAKKPAVKLRPDGRPFRKGESEKFPDYFNKGGIYYSYKDINNPVSHKNVGGKMVALTEPEKKEYRARRAGKRPEEKPATQGYGKDFIGGQGRGIIPQQPSLTPAQPKIDTQQTIGDLEARTAPSKGLKGRKKEVVQGLIDALKPRNGETPEARVKRIEKFIKDNKIHVGGSYRLKAGETEKFIDAELSFKVFMALKDIGVTLTHKNDKPVDTDKFAATATDGGKKPNPFKPQNTFGPSEDDLDVKNVTRDETGNVTGCTVEGIRLDVITPDEENRIIEERVSQVRQRYEGEMSEEDLTKFLENVEEYIRARNREHKANIYQLVKTTETATKTGKKITYVQFPRENETSEAAAARMVGKLDELVVQYITDPDKQNTARTALNDMVKHATTMRTAKTLAERREAVRKYNEALKAFQEAAVGSEVGKHIVDVGESLVALRSVVLGKTVLIPSSQSYPVADVLTIGINPVTGENSIEVFVVHVDAAESISVADSVKAGLKGNAGVSHEKDAHSEFSPVGTISGKDVKDDLIKMSNLDRKNAIFTTDGKLAPAEKERIIGELEKYGDEVRAYFGLPTDPSDDGYLDANQLYDFLSYGKKIACVDGKSASSKDGTRTGDTDPAVNPQNAEQWQAWSVVGLMHEAVHNRTIKQQFYRTSQIKRDGLVIADGARTMARAEFQFSKNPVRSAKHNGAKVPDSAMPSFSIPAKSLDDLQSGDPCKE